MKQYLRIITAGTLGLTTAFAVMVLLYAMATGMHRGKSILDASEESVLIFIGIAIITSSGIAAMVILACLKKAWEIGSAFTMILAVAAGLAEILSDQFLLILIMIVVVASIGLWYSYQKALAIPANKNK
ncbi:MAG: hypothetical protein PHT88_02545 [Candidatus Moranbacteria bacterium]|nr:hypothetical protein [Candidatus Moranbacteria bacterium]